MLCNPVVLVVAAKTLSTSPLRKAVSAIERKGGYRDDRQHDSYLLYECVSSKFRESISRKRLHDPAQRACVYGL